MRTSYEKRQDHLEPLRTLCEEIKQDGRASDAALRACDPSPFRATERESIARLMDMASRHSGLYQQHDELPDGSAADCLLDQLNALEDQLLAEVEVFETRLRLGSQ